MDIPTCAETECNNPRLRFTSKTGKVSYRKYCVDHWSERLRGLRREDGERTVDKNGYVHVIKDGVFVKEHKLVMEQILGRPLIRGESVHHKDGHRDNNDPDNLELWLGPTRYGVRASDIPCPCCGQAYTAHYEKEKEHDIQ